MSQSSKSWEDAAQGAVYEASKTLRNIRSLYIEEFTAEADNGKVSNYRINAKTLQRTKRTLKAVPGGSLRIRPAFSN